MKSTILYGLGFLSILTGAMLGDNEKIMPCIVCIVVGCILISIAVGKEKANEKADL